MKILIAALVLLGLFGCCPRACGEIIKGTVCGREDNILTVYSQADDRIYHLEKDGSNYYLGEKYIFEVNNGCVVGCIPTLWPLNWPGERIGYIVYTDFGPVYPSYFEKINGRYLIWVYFFEFGSWAYVDSRSETNVKMYLWGDFPNSPVGWVYTNSTLWPYMYHYETQTFIYHE